MKVIPFILQMAYLPVFPMNQKLMYDHMMLLAQQKSIKIYLKIKKCHMISFYVRDMENMPEQLLLSKSIKILILNGFRYSVLVQMAILLIKSLLILQYHLLMLKELILLYLVNLLPWVYSIILNISKDLCKNKIMVLSFNRLCCVCAWPHK